MSTTPVALPSPRSSLQRIVQLVLALVVAATTVSLAPSSAQAAVPDKTTVLQVLGSGRQVDLVRSGTDLQSLLGSVTGLLGADLTDSVATFTSGGSTWTYALPDTELRDVTRNLTFDPANPLAAGLRLLSAPTGQGAALPDGTYVVQTVSRIVLPLLGQLRLVSGPVTAALQSAGLPSAPTGVVFGGTGADPMPTWPTGILQPGSKIVVELLDALGQQVGTCETFDVTATGCTVGQVTGPAVRALVYVVDQLGGQGAVTEVQGPTAPTGVTARPGNGQVTVAWQPSSPRGAAVSGYTVRSDQGQTCQTTGTTCTVTGLTNGTAYSFVVTAFSGSGASTLQGDPSDATAPVVPGVVPGTPTLDLATTKVTADTADLRWRAPAANGGAPISAYVLKVDGRTIALNGSTTRFVVTGLRPLSRYPFTLTARNATGDGSPLSMIIETGSARTAISPATPGTASPATGRLTAAIAPKARRSGARAALVKVDLNRPATVVVRVVRGKLVASRTVALGSRPTFVSVPVAKKSRKLLNGKAVSLQVRTTTGATVKAVKGKVKR